MKNNGFSLVELSIVLVILGLLTGGVLTGQSLVRAAELRSITTEVNEYTIAVNTFKGKYFGLPGDIDTAERFWPGETADGDVNSIVDESSSGAASAGEAFMFWNQLALANMIQGNYTGLSGASNDGVLFDENVPSSKMGSGMGYQILTRDYVNDNTSNGFTNSLAYNHVTSMVFGAKTAPSDFAGNPALIPEEAWNIETKIDDGMPATGNVITMKFNNDCTVANTGTKSKTNFDLSYNLSDEDPQCAFLFRNLF